MAEANDKRPLPYCWFCGKLDHEVSHLFAGPTALICDECVNLCRDIIDVKRIEMRRATAGELEYASWGAA